MAELSQQRRNLILCLSLAALTAVVYSPVRDFGFVNYDDNMHIMDNAHVREGLTFKSVIWAFTNPSDGGVPLTWLVRMVECQMFGLDGGAHHLVNVLFHLTNTLLLFGVLNRMTAAPWRSSLVAALFALHPLHVESVAWVTELKDVLSACFWMLATWAYILYVEKPSARRYLRALGLYALGLMAKPMVVTLPLVLLLLDYWPLGRTPWAQPAAGSQSKAPLFQRLNEKLPFFGLATVSCVMAFWAQHLVGTVAPLERVTLAQRAGNAVVTYVRYLGKTLWPSGLAVFYPFQSWPTSTVLSCGVILVCVTAFVLRTARRSPQFLVGWLWYLGTLVPVIGLVQAGSQSMADRYTYLPLIGLFIMIAWAVPTSAIEPRIPKTIAASTAALLLFLCAGLSWSQIHYWKDSVTLFQHALDVTTNNALAHYNLGCALLERGRLPEAVEHLEQAIRIGPESAEAHTNLGLALMREGKAQQAMGQWEQALKINPDYVEARTDLGNALLGLGKIQEAAEQYTKALQSNPDYAEAHNNLAVVLYRQGKAQEAIRHWKEALRLKPDYAQARINLEKMGVVP